MNTVEYQTRAESLRDDCFRILEWFRYSCETTKDTVQRESSLQLLKAMHTSFERINKKLTTELNLMELNGKAPKTTALRLLAQLKTLRDEHIGNVPSQYQ